ncbi:MAG: hypothetical protein M5R36_00625 [Deltaproteobacteria bacterium]|nr:hypothetical protein [Deltaproteobacteria bacterium]
MATLLQSRNIRVLHDQDALGLACEAVTEAASVIRSAGITLLTDHPERLVGDFLERTADQSSAMLQAMQTGRASEIDAQNGAVVALAEEYGLDAPVNRTLLRLGRALEATLRAE